VICGPTFRHEDADAALQLRVDRFHDVFPDMPRSRFHTARRRAHLSAYARLVERPWTLSSLFAAEARDGSLLAVAPERPTVIRLKLLGHDGHHGHELLAQPEHRSWLDAMGWVDRTIEPALRWDAKSLLVKLHTSGRWVVTIHAIQLDGGWAASALFFDVDTLGWSMQPGLGCSHQLNIWAQDAGEEFPKTTDRAAIRSWCLRNGVDVAAGYHAAGWMPEGGPVTLTQGILDSHAHAFLGRGMEMSEVLGLGTWSPAQDAEECGCPQLAPLSSLPSS
jgi:hypothetical protein